MAQRAADAAKRPADAGHNTGASPPVTLDKITRSDRARLRLGHIAKMRPVIAQLEEIEAMKKAVQKQLTVLRNAYKGDGFLLGVLDAKLKNEKMPRRKAQEIAQEEYELAEDLGQAVYQQPDLFDAMTEEAKDETWWHDEGYQQGLMGKPLKLPAGIPPRMDQPFSKGWHAGDERLKWAQAGSTNPEKVDTGIRLGSQVPAKDETEEA